MSAHETWLTTALAVAGEAGELLRTYWQGPYAVRWKGYRDLVTEADVAAEQLVLARLRHAFPDHAITSEEAGAEEGDAPVRWLVDPLDGTTNFSRHHPNFCLSIAAVEAGEVVVGVICDPLHGHTFAARQGGGATLNGQPIHSSAVTDPAEALVGVDWPRDDTLRQRMWQLAGVFLRHGRTLRAAGTAALASVYVAAGWLDLYVGLTLKPWDHAAAGLIVREAGGCCATFSGTPWTPWVADPVLGATPALVTAWRALWSQEV